MGLFQLFKKKEKENISKREKETILDIDKQVDKEVMPKSNKRKTIPKEVKELVKEGKDEEVKAIMKKCQVNAYDTYYKNTILCYEGISSELVQHFMKDGYDINYIGRWDETPLHHQAGKTCENLQTFIDLGANIHAKKYMDKTPLHCAAMYKRTYQG